MGEEYYIRGAPRIPPFMVVVSDLFSCSIISRAFLLFILVYFE